MIFLLLFLEIIGALCLCDLIAFFAYSIKYLPTGFTEGVCYPFFIPLNMNISIIIRAIQIMVLIVAAIFFQELSYLWKILLPIGTGIFTIIYSIIFCNINY